MQTKLLSIDMIEATAATQIRCKLHKDIIDMYQKDIEAGDKMPPLDVFCEKGSSRHILADGFHRLYAFVNAEIDECEVNVHEGGMHEALAFALASNRTHGLRRSNADKINAVKLALKDPEFSQLTQGQIAELCGVSRETVNRIAGKEKESQSTGDSEPGQPEANKPENNRQTMPEPTQEEIELQELRVALSAIKVLPYEGAEALKLELNKDDVADLEYVATWCSHAVVAYRSGESND